jgi:hypothetical protein
MVDASRSDRRFQKIAIGLAVENGLQNGYDDRTIDELHENPSSDKIAKTYRRMISSNIQQEREIALWLELGLYQEPTTFPDITELLRRIREIEAILYALLGHAGLSITQPLNNWLNYVANAGESINTGFWIDAKAYMDRAVEAADETLTKVGSADPKMLYDLDILRSETRRDHEELLKASFRLKLPEDALNQILVVQDLLIRILRRRVAEADHKSAELLLFISDRLTIAERSLLQEKPDMQNAVESVTQSISQIENQIPTLQDETVRRGFERTLQELKEIQEDLKTPLKQP